MNRLKIISKKFKNSLLKFAHNFNRTATKRAVSRECSKKLSDADDCSLYLKEMQIYRQVIGPYAPDGWDDSF